MIRRMVRRVACIGLLLCGTLGLGGCQEEVGRAPVARFEITPKYVPIHDGYSTVVALNGSKSKDEIDDPAGTLPLSFHWDVDDPELQVVGGNLDAAQVQIKVGGDRPTTVTLTVTDTTGRSGVRTGYVGVTVDGPDGGAVPADAGAGDATASD